MFVLAEAGRPRPVRGGGGIVFLLGVFGVGVFKFYACIFCFLVYCVFGCYCVVYPNWFVV